MITDELKQALHAAFNKYVDSLILDVYINNKGAWDGRIVSDRFQNGEQLGTAIEIAIAETNEVTIQNADESPLVDLCKTLVRIIDDNIRSIETVWKQTFGRTTSQTFRFALAYVRQCKLNIILEVVRGSED